MESAVFEVNTSVTRKSCRVQAKARMAHRMRELYAALTGFALATALMYATNVSNAWMGIALVAVVALYTALVVPVTAARLYSSRHRDVNSVFMMFDADGFRVVTSVEDTRFGYDQITGMEERSGYMILNIRHHTPLAFRREEVLGGRGELLKAHLEGKTGAAFRSHGR